jgi:hypothetical protein
MNTNTIYKQIKTNNKLTTLFTKPILGSEVVKINERVFYMMIEDLGIKVNRRKENDSIINTKKCNNCGVEKSVDYFYTDNHSEDGYHIRCKSCDDRINKKYHSNYSFVSVN